MNDQLWSWILTAVGLTGFVLAGRKVWWCWYINIGCQALWFTYAIVTEQYGFIVASLAYTFVFTKNAIRWTRDHREKARMLLPEDDPLFRAFCGLNSPHDAHWWFQARKNITSKCSGLI